MDTVTPAPPFVKAHPHYMVRKDCRIEDDPLHIAAFRVVCGFCGRTKDDLTIEQARAARAKHEEGHVQVTQ